MKLLMVTNFFESHRGGLELSAGRLARELVRLGEHVRLLASDIIPPPHDDELGGRVTKVKALNITEARLGIPFPFPRPSAI